jgi:hypothetical protein
VRHTEKRDPRGRLFVCDGKNRLGVLEVVCDEQDGVLEVGLGHRARPVPALLAFVPRLDAKISVTGLVLSERESGEGRDQATEDRDEV